MEFWQIYVTIAFLLIEYFVILYIAKKVIKKYRMKQRKAAYLSKAAELSGSFRAKKAKQSNLQKSSTLYAFSRLYDCLADGASASQIHEIGKAAAQYILTIEPLNGFRLHTQNYDRWRSCEPSAWETYCTEQEYRAILCLGTLHENGYYREKCLRLLRNDAQALPYILLRVNDWVPGIRRMAAGSLPYLIEDAAPGALMDAMPYFNYLMQSTRCHQDFLYKPWEIYPQLTKRFAEQPEQVFCKAVRVRRLCYETIFLKYQENFDTQVQMELIHCWMSGEKDGAQRSWLVSLYLYWCKTDIPLQELEAFQNDKQWRIRYFAHIRRLRQNGIWEGFENLLLDKAASIRELAAFWLEKVGFDVIAFCRSHRPESIPALGEWGTKADIPYIRQYLAEYPCECMRALVRLGAENAEALLWEYLHSENAKAARTAFRIAWSRHIRFPEDALLSELNTTEDPKLRWRLVKLLGESGDWRALPALLRLLREYSHLRTDILHAIEKRNPWQEKLSPELAAQIEQALKDSEGYVPVQTAQMLRFDLHRLTDSI